MQRSTLEIVVVLLLNSKGELIGINTVKYSSEDVEGMGYAIPINTAKPIINKLIKNEATSESEQAYLGVSGQTIDSSMASQFDMPSGVYVQQVIKSSPAQKAGISAGDVIVSFNGSNVSTMDGLKEKISNLKAGKKVKVVVKRQNQMGTYEKKTLTVTLGKKSDAPSTSSNSRAIVIVITAIVTTIIIIMKVLTASIIVLDSKTG